MHTTRDPTIILYLARVIPDSDHGTLKRPFLRHSIHILSKNHVYREAQTVPKRHHYTTENIMLKSKTMLTNCIQNASSEDDGGIGLCSTLRYSDKKKVLEPALRKIPGVQ